MIVRRAECSVCRRRAARSQTSEKAVVCRVITDPSERTQT